MKTLVLLMVSACSSQPVAQPAAKLTTETPQCEAQCPAGPSGPEGPTGAAGLNGLDGVDGLDGTVGPTGPQGSPGSMGPTGPQGLIGAAGPTGPVGAVGATGPRGLDAPATAQSGTRLTVVSDQWVGTDGSVWRDPRLHFHDADLSVDCEVRQDVDGARYCVPMGWWVVRYPVARFLSSNCTGATVLDLLYADHVDGQEGLQIGVELVHTSAGDLADVTYLTRMPAYQKNTSGGCSEDTTHWFYYAADPAENLLVTFSRP